MPTVASLTGLRFFFLLYGKGKVSWIPAFISLFFFIGDKCDFQLQVPAVWTSSWWIMYFELCVTINSSLGCFFMRTFFPLVTEKWLGKCSNPQYLKHIEEKITREKIHLKWSCNTWVWPLAQLDCCIYKRKWLGHRDQKMDRPLKKAPARAMRGSHLQAKGSSLKRNRTCQHLHLELPAPRMWEN